MYWLVSDRVQVLPIVGKGFSGEGNTINGLKKINEINHYEPPTSCC